MKEQVPLELAAGKKLPPSRRPLLKSMLSASLQVRQISSEYKFPLKTAAGWNPWRTHFIRRSTACGARLPGPAWYAGPLTVPPGCLLSLSSRAAGACLRSCFSSTCSEEG